jgi:hypothetical protein
LSYAPTVGIWLVGRTEIIASDRLFSQTDALIPLEDLIGTILRYTHGIRTIQQIFSAASMTARRIQSALTSRSARSVSRLLSCAALH